MSSSTSSFSPSTSQQRWVQQTMINYLKNKDIQPCVFQLPDNLKETMPEAYIPQIVGLGPYHHFRPEVQFMTSKKLDALKDYLKSVPFGQFISGINNSFKELGPIIHPCYDRYLDLDKMILPWIMILDGLFLLHFIDSFWHSTELRGRIYLDVEKLVLDVFMLENQIPVILIQKMIQLLGIASNIPRDRDVQLLFKFYFFCCQHSPLELTSAPLQIEACQKHMHNVLDFMYLMILKNDCSLEHDCDNDDVHRGMFGLIVAWVKVAYQGREIFQFAVEEFKSAFRTATEKVSGDKRDMPSVSKLIAILNMKFKPLPEGYGIKNINVKIAEGNYKRQFFYLPEIYMRANSEIILRNLIAYESAISKQKASTPMREYANLICGRRKM